MGAQTLSGALRDAIPPAPGTGRAEDAAARFGADPLKWVKHDVSTGRSPRVIRLEHTHGLDAYARYIHLRDWLAEKSGHVLDIEEDARELPYVLDPVDCAWTEEDARAFVGVLEGMRLLELREDGYHIEAVDESARRTGQQRAKGQKGGIAKGQRYRAYEEGGYS